LTGAQQREDGEDASVLQWLVLMASKSKHFPALIRGVTSPMMQRQGVQHALNKKFEKYKYCMAKLSSACNPGLVGSSLVRKRAGGAPWLLAREVSS
jgi:hypothetical protein